MNILEAIECRTSVRNFKNEPLSASDLSGIKSALPDEECGPFGNRLRAAILHPTKDNPKAIDGLGGLLGTYGFIKNAQAYAVAALKPAPFALNDFGFLLEGAVLKATQLGIGSCWLGGSFRPGPFGVAINAQGDEFIPAVIAFGYPSPKPRIADKLIKMHHNKGNRRAAWETLFFHQNDFHIPADPANNISTTLLRAVHAAPSSCNTQPWRIAKEDHCFHFFFQRNSRYTKKDKLIGNADLQMIDMGIAMRHFEISARECKINGKWVLLENPHTKNVPENTNYLISWQHND
ncbi:MAG: hypothetical protein JXR40_07135 [Pontiellaceae bacterium]|nr:hypothetical protein [Pontiellaceae bacterium]